MLKIKKIFSADIIKVSFLSGISTVIKMIASFVTMKVVAQLGPSAIALLGQLNNFSTIVQSASNGGITLGVTKYVAQYSGSERRYSLFIGTSVWITIVLSLLSGIYMILFANYLSIHLLKDAYYAPVFYAFGATVIFYAFNTLLLAIINGFKEFKKYVIANVIGSIVGLIFSVILATQYGTFGALIAVVTYQSVVFVITLAIVAKTRWFKVKDFFGKFSKSAAIKLGHFSLMALFSAAIVPTSQLIIRNYITTHNSIQEAGLWEGVNRISMMYLLVITTSLSVYYLPRLTEIKTNKDLRAEVKSVYKLIIPFLLLATATIFVTKGLVIQILFSDKFTGMKDYFLFQLMGDIFKMSGWVLGYILMARSMTRTFIIMEIISGSLMVGLSILFVNTFGSVGATMGYALTHFTYLVLMLFVLRKQLFYSLP